MLKIHKQHRTQIINVLDHGNQALGEVDNKGFYPTNCPYYFDVDDLRLIIQAIQQEGDK